jgi:pimeloyl-ACP methyl ester carboxylesterase
MDLTERFAWRGREVAWVRHGHGPAVVFCHGTPWSSRLWSPYADALAYDHTVYLWDMPGYGRSSMRAGDAVDLGVQGELLADLLLHWGLERPHLVTHDIGGAVALRALLLHAAAYASLVLVDVVALGPWGSPYFKLVADNADVFAAQPPPVHRGALEAYIRGAAHAELTASELAMLTGPWLTEAGQPAFYRQIAEADEAYTDEIEPRYAEVDIPTLVVWGREDRWIPPDRAERLAAMIPGARLALVADAGHLVQLDKPVALATLLTGWLRDQIEPAGRAVEE